MQHIIQSIQQFLTDPHSLRLDRLDWTGNTAEQRSGFHYLMQLIRNRTLIEHLIAQQAKRPPKALLKAVIAYAVVQMLERPDDVGTHAKIIHHAVDLARELCSKQESGFVNAVSRKISSSLPEQLDELEKQQLWHIRYSHPKWLIQRWKQQHGPEATQQLLLWNQQIPTTYVHDVHGALAVPTEELENRLQSLGLETSAWKDFYSLKKAGRQKLEQLLKDPFYIQDPSTRIAPSLFSHCNQPDAILDACAAPGGKTVHLYKHLHHMGIQPQTWIAADLTLERLEWVETNMTRLQIPGIQVCVADWEQGIPESMKQFSFDWILIDAPCTSTGVIQKHPEIRWRLKKEDYPLLPARQLAILSRCSALLKPGGSLVYSTCSIDPAENQDVVHAFLASPEGSTFRLIKTETTLPPLQHHDGVGAFLLEKAQVVG